MKVRMKRATVLTDSYNRKKKLILTTSFLSPKSYYLLSKASLRDAICYLNLFKSNCEAKYEMILDDHWSVISLSIEVPGVLIQSN